MTRQDIKNIRALVDELMFSQTKAAAKTVVPKLNIAASSLSLTINANAVDKLHEVIAYATDASGQPRNKEHWVSCANSSWSVFESLVSDE